MHPRPLALELRRELANHPTEVMRVMDITPPALTYSGPAAVRDSRELMSEIASRIPAGGDALDLGCGPRDQAGPLAHLGFQYLGVDYANRAADLLADAHALPLADASFDCVFSYAVLEHLHCPLAALHEIARVLRPGGFFIGTVSQGEPFHDSYLHHTPWGVIALVAQVPGLRVRRLWPSVDTLAALAVMGRYSRALRLLLRGLDWLNAKCPWLTPRKMRWPAFDRQLDRLYRAGSVCFTIEKVAQTQETGDRSCAQ